MKRLYIAQAVLHILVGIGALFGGTMAIMDPYGVTFGMPIEVLRKGPFSSFLIPGLFLFTFIGLGHLASFWLLKRRFRFHPYISGGVGCILMAWILIQCYILQSVHYLHMIFFLVGMSEGLIALYMLIKLKLFPFSKGSFSLHY